MTTTARELFEEYADKNSGWGALVVPNNPDAPIDESNHKWRKEHLKTWNAALASRPVRLPEKRKPMEKNWRLYNSGWNDCLDEITRLNAGAGPVDERKPDAVFEGGVWTSENNSDLEIFINNVLPVNNGQQYRVEFYRIDNEEKV